MGRDDDAHVLEHSVPDCWAPEFDIVGTKEQTYLHGWEEAHEDVVLLIAQRPGRCEEPNQL